MIDLHDPSFAKWREPISELISRWLHMLELAHHYGKVNPLAAITEEPMVDRTSADGRDAAAPQDVRLEKLGIPCRMRFRSDMKDGFAEYCIYEKDSNGREITTPVIAIRFDADGTLLDLGTSIQKKGAFKEVHRRAIDEVARAYYSGTTAPLMK